jgi:hypothetical protein
MCGYVACVPECRGSTTTLRHHDPLVISKQLTDSYQTWRVPYTTESHTYKFPTTITDMLYSWSYKAGMTLAAFNLVFLNTRKVW